MNMKYVLGTKLIFKNPLFLVRMLCKLIERLDDVGIYLGLPSVIGGSKRQIFNSIKDSVWKRIQGRKVRSLSAAS